MSINLPYRTESRQCYQRLKESRRVFQNGFEQMSASAQSESPFKQRLADIISIQGKTVESGRKEVSNTTWSEEDVFVCCAHDLLQAVFAQEAEKIAADPSTGKTQKQAGIKALIKDLNRIPYTGPTWNHATKPAIRKQLDEVLKRL